MIEKQQEWILCIKKLRYHDEKQKVVKYLYHTKFKPTYFWIRKNIKFIYKTKQLSGYFLIIARYIINDVVNEIGITLNDKSFIKAFLTNQQVQCTD